MLRNDCANVEGNNVNNVDYVDNVDGDFAEFIDQDSLTWIHWPGFTEIFQKFSHGHSLSNRLGQTARMKTRIKSLCGSKNGRIITTFGRAKLVSLRDGSVELRGAEAEERTAAKEWISLFMHEAVPRFEN